MPASLPGALIAALIGALIAYLNYSLTRKAAVSQDAGAGLSAAAPVLRMTLDVGYLAAVYFAAPHTPWDRTWLLVGAVVGLTLPLFIFTPLLVRAVNRRTDEGRTENRPAADRPESSDPPKGGDA